MAKTRKYNKEVSCHTTKTAAKKAAKAHRAKGNTATVVVKGGKHCVKTAGKSKK